PSETKNEQPDVRLIISKITSQETLILFDLFHDGYDFETAHFQFRGQVPLQSKWMETASFQRRCPHRFGLGSSTEGFPRSRGDKEATTGRNSRSKRHSKSPGLRVEVIFRSTCPSRWIPRKQTRRLCVRDRVGEKRMGTADRKPGSDLKSCLNGLLHRSSRVSE
ncbi:hypothetical protein CGCFRS4_v015985, partial [Colletotrichum fructicola]